MDCTDRNGNTPLHQAVMNGHVGIVRMLSSEFGAAAAAYITNGNSASNLVSSKGDVEVLCSGDKVWLQS